jgi:hypothetical protein
VAPLTHRFQIIVSAIHPIVIEMGHREHDFPLRPFCWFTVAFDAAAWARMRAMQSAFPFTFTLTATSRSNTLADSGPVLRVFRSIKWHSYSIALARHDRLISS